VPVGELRRALNADARTRVGTRLDTVRVMERDSSGRAVTIAVHGEHERLVRGEALRAILARASGPRSVRSTLFTVRRDAVRVVFEGRGFGHGVGLCQAGALARLAAGASPERVLQRYFPRTTVRRLGT
jgi:stage II sporulation protein D